MEVVAGEGEATVLLKTSLGPVRSTSFNHGSALKTKHSSPSYPQRQERQQERRRQQTTLNEKESSAEESVMNVESVMDDSSNTAEIAAVIDEHAKEDIMKTQSAEAINLPDPDPSNLSSLMCCEFHCCAGTYSPVRDCPSSGHSYSTKQEILSVSTGRTLGELGKTHVHNMYYFFEYK